MKDIPQGVVLKVKVIPKARITEIIGWEGDTLKIRLKAVPEKGKANAELIAFLAKKLHVSKSFIELTRGETSRQKTLFIAGLDTIDL